MTNPFGHSILASRATNAERRKGNQTMNENQQNEGETLTNAETDLFCNFVNSYEKIEANEKLLRDDKKALIKDLESEGFNPRAFRQVVKERKKDIEELQDDLETLRLYREILNLPV